MGSGGIRGNTDTQLLSSNCNLEGDYVTIYPMWLSAAENANLISKETQSEFSSGVSANMLQEVVVVVDVSTQRCRG